MKTVITAAALVLTAGIASATTASDFDRFGVDAGSLTNSERLLVENAIASDATHSEVQSLINSIKKDG